MIPATFALESRIATLLAEAPVATFSCATSRGYVVVKAQAIDGGVRVELRLVGVGPILPDALTAEEYVGIVERAERALGEKRGGPAKAPTGLEAESRGAAEEVGQ